MSAVIFDPPAVAAGGHKELALGFASVTEGIYIKKDPGPDWGDAEIQAFIADQEVGAAMIDYRLPPRKITIPLVVKATTAAKFDELRSQLQAKAMRINEEGAVMKRELPSGKVYYCDVFEAKLHLAGDWFTERRATDLNATLELQAQPDWYQDPVAEAIAKGTGDVTKVFPNIKGNLPGRVELTFTNESTADQLALAWAFRAKRFSSAETAKPAYEAEELTALDATAEATLTGASNGKVLKHSNLSTGWTPIASTNLKATGSYLTHQGIFDVWVRVHTTSATPPTVRLLSAVGDTVSASEGPQYTVPGANNFYMVPVGQINLRTTPFGTHRWQGILQAYGPAGGENISIDRIYFWSGEESSGIPRAPLGFLSTQTGYALRDEFNQASHGLNGEPLAGVLFTKGPITGNIGEAAGAGLAWANPGNAKTINGSYAVATGTVNTGGVTNVLKLTEFGLAVPETATILGVAVEVTAHSSHIGSGGAVSYIKNVGLIKAGTVEEGGGKSKNDFGFTFLSEDRTRTYGGSSDMWANTLTPAQVNATNFGVFVQAEFNAAIGGETPSFSVDAVRVYVWYSDGSSSKWATSGDAIDLTIDGANHQVFRNEVSDATINAGRYAIAGTGTFTNVIVGIKTFDNYGAGGGQVAGDLIRSGAIARYTNESNWLMGVIDRTSSAGGQTDRLKIVKMKAGTPTELLSVAIPVTTAYFGWRYVWLEVEASGRALLWAQLSESGAEELIGVAFDTDLATGGTLATGKVGFYDAKTGSTACSRVYDSFTAWTNTHDAVAFAGRSAILATQGLQRQTVDGAGYAAIAYPGSDLPRIPISGYEERPVELMAKTSRGAFDAIPDSGLDPFGLQLTYRPCWSAIPKE